jgi:surface protein
MSDALPWADASAACQAAGQQLAIVQSAEQNALVRTAAAGNSVWIGGTDAASEGTWVWSPSNTPLSYFNWANNEPNNIHGGEDCLLIYGSGSWNDGGCTSTLKYVCQTACPVAPSPSPPLPSPSPPSPSPPTPPPPPCHNFTSTSDLKKALQEFDADASTAEATYGAIAEWCVSAITDMHWLFYNLKNFNAGGVSNWDTSGVTDMNGMFRVRSTRAP